MSPEFPYPRKYKQKEDEPMSRKEAIEKLEELFADILWDNLGENFKRRADSILALLRAEEPEAGEFTKEIQEICDNPRRHIFKSHARKLCDIIDRLTAELKDKCSDLDAECRVSQILLVEVKKLKRKQDAD